MRTRVLPIRHSLCWFLFGLSRHTVTCVAYLHPPSRVLLFFQDVEQQKKGCGLRHFRFCAWRRRFVAADMVTSFFGLSQVRVTVQVRVYMHPYVCMYVRLNLNLILMVLLFFGRIGGNTPLPIRALACAFAMWALVCARGRSRSHLREHIVHTETTAVSVCGYSVLCMSGVGVMCMPAAASDAPTRTVRHPSP